MTDNEVKWMIVGKLLGRGLIAQKEPVAYLYNGLRFPALPERDETAYPYAYILKNMWGSYMLLFSTSPATHDAGSEEGYYSISGLKFYGREGDPEWEPQGTAGLQLGRGIWCNTPLYNYDGSLYLAASDPVPVYE